METPSTTRGSFRDRLCALIVAFCGFVFPRTSLRGGMSRRVDALIVLHRVGALIVALGFVGGAVYGAVRWPIAARDLPRDARALTFLDRHGTPLGTILGRDDRHTVAVTLGRIAPAFRQAVIAAEDRRFYAHGALDGFAALRALRDALAERRLPHGASTLSMQLARTLVSLHDDARGKVIEVLVATRLEAGMSKDEILAAWCNRAPMGGNLYGVEAAALTYFGVHAADLDLAQSALLAALPNDPVRLDPYARFAALRARQRYVLERMRSAGDIDADTERRAASEEVALRPRAADIVAAPHFLFALAPQVAPERARVRTTLDLPLQRFVAAQVRDVVGTLRGYDVHHAAALVVDNQTGQILAYVGSRDYFSDADFGRNDGVTALRQPGSALKPFLYELALDRRAIRPDTILADVPASYALPGARLYEPVDYSARFLGPVRVRIALADSLNVPAVRVLARVGVDTFLARLHALGFAHLTRPAAYYGLGLGLGGGEVTLAELARAYASAARGGAPTALVSTLDGSVASRATVGAPHERSWALVTDMLADRHARAEAFGVDSILALPFAAAVKTGTSSGYRDTWTAGYTRDYTVAVWVGNFDGRPMRGISGVSGAGPLWSRIMLHLYEGDEPPPFLAPAGFVRRAICTETGARVDASDARGASSACTPVLEWFDARDLASSTRAASAAKPAPAAAYDPWLVYQPRPSSARARILFPHDGDAFAFVPGVAHQALAFEFIGATGEPQPRVALNGSVLRAGAGESVWNVRPGRYELVVGSGAQRDAVQFAVTTTSAKKRGFVAR